MSRNQLPSIMEYPSVSKTSMSRFHRKSKKRASVRSRSSISWPVESGREVKDDESQAESSPLAHLTLKTTIKDDQRSIAGSWYTEGSELDSDATIDSPISSAPSVRDARTDSTCSDCSHSCFEQASFMAHDKLPSQEILDLAGEVEILDGNGEARPFKSLYTGDDAIGEQQLIVFVRHFFCTACQSYLRAMSRAINMRTYLSLPIPTSITIIGLGHHSLISTYRSNTSTKFPIFTDPSRRLHKLLGMSWSLNIGRRPEYDDLGVRNGGPEIVRQFRSLEVDVKDKRTKAGAFWWVGGEFLVRDGKIVWCHRMKNYRDHVEMDVIKDLLGVERH